MTFDTLKYEKDDTIVVIRFSRPEQMNAFNDLMMRELTGALDAAEADAEVGCIIITGSEKVFAAGADIKEMRELDYAQAYETDFVTATWERVTRCRKPVIAAVAGHAVGGGCELALMCDIIIAAENAKFSQPEIRLGVSPGAGGTQRLTRVIGKSKTMEMVLTGRVMEAAEAERANLVSRIVPVTALVEEAKTLARKIAGMPRGVAMQTKEMVNIAYETTLSQGVRFERRIFQSQFGQHAQKEGMDAFLENRTPHFRKPRGGGRES